MELDAGEAEAIALFSHFTRNYLYVKRHHPEKLEAHVPEFAKRIVSQYRLPKS